MIVLVDNARDRELETRKLGASNSFRKLDYADISILRIRGEWGGGEAQSTRTPDNFSMI